MLWDSQYIYSTQSYGGMSYAQFMEEFLPDMCDIGIGIWASSVRNFAQIMEPLAVPIKMLDNLSIGREFDYKEALESYRKGVETYGENLAKEARDLTLFYTGECIGDVLTIVGLFKAGQDTSQTNGLTGSASTVLKEA